MHFTYIAIRLGETRRRITNDMHVHSTHNYSEVLLRVCKFQRRLKLGMHLGAAGPVVVPGPKVSGSCFLGDNTPWITVQCWVSYAGVIINTITTTGILIHPSKTSIPRPSSPPLLKYENSRKTSVCVGPDKAFSARRFLQAISIPA